MALLDSFHCTNNSVNACSDTLDPDQHISTIFTMRNVIQDLNIFSLLYLIPHSCKAKVEILNYFGDLTLETGGVFLLACY